MNSCQFTPHEAVFLLLRLSEPMQISKSPIIWNIAEMSQIVANSNQEGRPESEVIHLLYDLFVSVFTELQVVIQIAMEPADWEAILFKHRGWAAIPRTASRSYHNRRYRGSESFPQAKTCIRWPAKRPALSSSIKPGNQTPKRC